MEQNSPNVCQVRLARLDARASQSDYTLFAKSQATILHAAQSQTRLLALASKLEYARSSCATAFVLKRPNRLELSGWARYISVQEAPRPWCRKRIALSLKNRDP